MILFPDARRMLGMLATPLLVALLAGCNAATPYPNTDNPIRGARVSANPHPAGSDAYCRTYARQTAANAYEGRIDRSEDGFGVRRITEDFARRDGTRAYQRCRAGRVN